MDKTPERKLAREAFQGDGGEVVFLDVAIAAIREACEAERRAAFREWDAMDYLQCLPDCELRTMTSWSPGEPIPKCTCRLVDLRKALGGSDG